MFAKYIILALGCLTLGSATPITSRESWEGLNPVGSCPSEDGELPTYLPDAKDCSIFYECIEGEAVWKLCMPGLCFDTTLKVCTVQEDTLFEDDEKTSYEIQDTSAAPQDCTDPPTEPPPEVTDPPTEPPPEVTVSTTEAPTEPPCGGLTCRPPGSDHNCPDRPGNPDGTCPPDQCSESTYLPDKDSDDIFFQCSNGRPIQMCCPAGLKWNRDCNACR